ncbi:MAG: class I SAM-dependent methyltransferase, partial [Longimicrobiales bacterium]
MGAHGSPPHRIRGDAASASRLFTQAPGEIVDIGGGPGKYAIALVQQGYTVTLVDLSNACLEFAKDRAREIGVELDAYVHGNAIDLTPLPRSRYDAALLMGPLYHLIAAEDRQQAVREAARVLKPGGLIFAAIIMRYAPLRYAAKHEPALISEDREGLERI